VIFAHEDISKACIDMGSNTSIILHMINKTGGYKMSDAQMGLLLGLMIGLMFGVVVTMVIVDSPSGQALLRERTSIVSECEKALPRNQHCEVRMEAFVGEEGQ